MGRIFIEIKGYVGISPFKHLYLVYQDDNDNEWVIRGGSEFTSGFITGNFGKLVLQYNAVLLKNSEDKREGLLSTDTPQDRGQVELKLGNRKAEDVWLLMMRHAKEINDAGLDYRDGVNLKPAQNSNSVIASILNSVGINPNVDLPNSDAIFSPGTSNLLSINTSIIGTDRDDTFGSGPGNNTFIGKNGTDLYSFSSTNNGNDVIDDIDRDGLISINEEKVHHKIIKTIRDASNKEVKHVMTDKKNMFYCVTNDSVGKKVIDKVCTDSLLWDLEEKIEYKGSDLSIVKDSISIKNFTSGTFGMGINNCNKEKVLNSVDDGSSGWVRIKKVLKLDNGEIVYFYSTTGSSWLYSQRLGIDGRKVGEGKGVVETSNSSLFYNDAIGMKDGGYVVFHSKRYTISGDNISSEINGQIFDKDDKLVKEFNAFKGSSTSVIAYKASHLTSDGGVGMLYAA